MSNRYRVLKGLNYPRQGREVRVEPGEVVSDLDAGQISSLTAIGAIEPEETASEPAAPAPPHEEE